MAPRLTVWQNRNWCQVSVVRIRQLASCWHLLQSPNSCCWRCPKRWKSQGARLGLYGGWSITSQPQHSNQSQSQLVVLYGAQWHLFGPLKHPAGKRFATDTNMKLSPRGYRLVALTSMPWYKPLCHGETTAEKSVATVKVWCVHRSDNKVLLTRVLVRNLIFLQIPCNMTYTFGMTHAKTPIKKQNSMNTQCLLSITKHGIFWSINFRLSCLILVTWAWLTVAEIY
jgi:hypothetical protein